MDFDSEREPERAAAAMNQDLSRLYETHHAMVYATAFRVLGSAEDAEDVLHTVFLRLLRRQDLVIEVDNAEAYLRRSAVNAALDVMRSRKPAGELEPDWLESTERSAEALAGDAQTRDRLRRALTQLPDRAGEVFVLRYVEDRPNKEIAEQLGMSQLAVAGALFRAKAKLRQVLRRDTRNERIKYGTAAEKTSSKKEVKP